MYGGLEMYRRISATPSLRPDVGVSLCGNHLGDERVVHLRANHDYNRHGERTRTMYAKLSLSSSKVMTTCPWLRPPILRVVSHLDPYSKPSVGARGHTNGRICRRKDP